MAKSNIIVISCAIGCAIALLLLPHLLNSGKGPVSSSLEQEESQVMTSTSAAMVLEAQPEADVSNMSRHQLLVLHRSKRYLLFPEGSSFQLVFDLIIPIVDYTNFAILGVTCAVAWELPSKPPSELVENLRTRLNDGTLGTVRRNGSVESPSGDEVGAGVGEQVVQANTNWQAVHAPTYTATDATNEQQHYAYYTNVQRGSVQTSAYANPSNGERPTNWHARQSTAKWRQWAANPAYPTRVPPGAAYATRNWSDNWWQRNKARVQQNWREKQQQQQWSSYPQTTAKSYVGYSQSPRQLLQEPPRHRIFPIFGKRRRRRQTQQDIDDEVFERLHLQQHLSSRALLFSKIERLYKSRQLNGTACIQRALCESSQRQLAAEQKVDTGDQPQSFVMELLSAIFQLPADEDAAEHIAPHYLEAHRMRGGDCRQLYTDCSHKFWFE